MLEIAIPYAMGLVVGIVAGISMVWDRRFTEGRIYGYRMGCERAVDDEMIKRIRGML